MAVEWLARHMEQTCGLNVDVEVDPQAEPESEEIRIVLFEAARELLFNVVKHAETGRARMKLATCPNGGVCLTVSDEGPVLPPDPKLEKTDASGFGLFSIRERLELLGGRLQVDTAPGRGTRITILSPSCSSRGSPAQGLARQVVNLPPGLAGGGPPRFFLRIHPMTIESRLQNQSKKRRVLLVDDHPLVRRGLADVIVREPDLEACGEAGDIQEPSARWNAPSPTWW